MSSSDYCASKCLKLNLSFQEAYPEQYAAYIAANTEFNENESRLEDLYKVLEEEQEQEMMTRAEGMPE